MPVSETAIVERIARVLAGRQLSGNAAGLEAHAGTSVDMEWKDRVADAVAILRTMREPDANMVKAGDVDVWRAMIGAAIDGHADVHGCNPLAAAIDVKATS
ncbi:MAG: hypothetical protein J7498_16210 [Sphingobium sp.]|nr:hypothetical protein [Sphingobium sp.]